MKLPEIAVRRPITTIMIFAGIALLGSVAFFKLNLDMLPDIEPFHSSLYFRKFSRKKVCERPFLRLLSRSLSGAIFSFSAFDYSGEQHHTILCPMH